MTQSDKSCENDVRMEFAINLKNSLGQVNISLVIAGAIHLLRKSSSTSPSVDVMRKSQRSYNVAMVGLHSPSSGFFVNILDILGFMFRSGAFYQLPGAPGEDVRAVMARHRFGHPADLQLSANKFPLVYCLKDSWIFNQELMFLAIWQ